MHARLVSITPEPQNYVSKSREWFLKYQLRIVHDTLAGIVVASLIVCTYVSLSYFSKTLISIVFTFTFTQEKLSHFGVFLENVCDVSDIVWSEHSCIMCIPCDCAWHIDEHVLSSLYWSMCKVKCIFTDHYSASMTNDFILSVEFEIAHLWPEMYILYI